MHAVWEDKEKLKNTIEIISAGDVERRIMNRPKFLLNSKIWWISKMINNRNITIQSVQNQGEHIFKRIK